MSYNFRNLITITEQKEGFDDYGSPIDEWVEVAKAWADIRTMRGNEFFEALQVGNVGVSRFIIRYIPDIESHMKIEFKGKQYDIQSIENDNEKNRTITIIGKVTN